MQLLDSLLSISSISPYKSIISTKQNVLVISKLEGERKMRKPHQTQPKALQLI